jgi:hypothetical protein
VGSVFDGIDARLGAWLERQPVFFVATAPLGADGHVNVSPKGTTGTFRVLDQNIGLPAWPVDEPVVG